MTVQDVDKGAKELLKTVKARPSVRVGVIGSLAEEPKTTSDEEEDEDEYGDLTVAAVAVFHEFGFGVPQRSFIAGYVDENEADVMINVKKVAKRMLLDGMSAKTAMGLLGAYIQGQIQERIAEGIPPDLDDRTIKRKGSDKPLIDTGQLRSSITYEVEKHG